MAGKQFIWELRLFGNFKLLGIYWNIPATDADQTEIKAGITLFDGLSWGICKDDKRYFISSVTTLRWL